MKKALALILTVAMLLSTVAIGASAARVVTEVPGVVDNAWFAVGENYNLNDFSNYVDGDFVYELVVKGEAGANNDKDPAYTATMNYGPYFDFANDKIGYGDLWATGGDNKLIDCDLPTDKWITIRYEVSGNDTAIYVDGAHVGTITDNQPMRPVVANTNYGTLVGSIKISDANGNVAFSEDFNYDNATESGATGGSIEAVVVSEASFKNENVAKSADNAWYAVGENYNLNDFSNYVDGDFVYELVVKGETGANNDKDPAYTATMNYGPYFDFANDKIGYGDLWATGGDNKLIDCDLPMDKWITIRYEVSGNDTDIYVDGAYVGTITENQPMRPVVANTNYGTLVSSIKISDANGNVAFKEDFNYENATDSGATGGSIESFTIEGDRYDLGMKYYDCTAEAKYTYIPDVQGTSELSFDFALAFEGASFYNIVNGPTISETAVGMAGKTLPATIAVGTWYHVDYVCDGTSTAVYLDGALLGTVEVAEIQWLSGIEYGLVDNISCDKFTEDFEDGVFNNLHGDSMKGDIVDYEFEIEEEVDPITLLPNPAAEGSAQLIEVTQDFASLLISHNGYDITSNKVVYAFDLALVPNDGAQTDTANEAWFEIWSDIASRRYKIGTTAMGVDDTQTLIEWGEATKDNFHDVVIAVNGRTVSMYLDRVLVFEGAAGNHAAIGNMTIFAAMNSSAIIDNLTIYNGSDLSVWNEVSTDFDWTSNGGEWNAQTVEIGADCASIGHIYGSTVRTIAETCYSLGEDTIYCGNCGATMYTETVAMVSHKFEKYDINRVDENGLIYSNCSNGGCVERMYVEPAAADSYTGTMHAFFDMQDALFAEINRAQSSYWIGDNMKYENGVAIMDETTWIQNYTEFYPKDYITSPVKNNDFSFTFDMTYNGMWAADDTVAAGGGYNNLFELCLGGDSQFIGRVGYDAVKGVFYSMPWSGTAFGTVEEEYAMIEGETYNVSISLEWNYLTEEELDEGEIEPFLALIVRVNGEVVLEYSTDTDPDEAYYSYTASEVKDMTLFFVRDFGLAYEMDNLVIGTADFAWTNRTYVGDVDGDNALTANDALCMRKFLAKVIDDSALAVSRMDANNDGAINAKDQLTIRKALVA